MAISEKYGQSLVENLLTLLGHSDEHGKIVHAMLDTQLLEGNYRLIGERFANYWRQYREAPKLHAADLFDDIFSDTHDHRAGVIKRMLRQMVVLSEGINAAYVLRQLQTFTRQQSLKQAVLSAANVLARPSENSNDEVEQILRDIGRAQAIGFDPGVRLDDLDRIEAYLKRETREFTSGVKLLDQHSIIPARGRVMLLVGGKGVGKSWFLVNCGRRNLDLRHKILHVTLENSEDETLLRYWQSTYSIPKHELSEVRISKLVTNNAGRMERQDEMVPVEFDLHSDLLRTELETRLMEMTGAKAENLRIKYFTTGQLTIPELSSFLDLLERVENFIPDMLIVDYPRLMKIDARNPRFSIGQNMVGLRGLAHDRNMAVVAVDQLSREGNRARVARSTHIGEDWSQILTADIALIVSMTEREQQFGLCRLYVDHARTEKDKFGLLLIHNHTIGQFCIESYKLPDNYFDEVLHEETSDDAETEPEEN